MLQLWYVQDVMTLMVSCSDPMVENTSLIIWGNMIHVWSSVASTSK